MAFRAVYTDATQRKLEKILDYTIEEFGFDTAKKFYASIQEAVRLATMFPGSNIKCTEPELIGTIKS